jgi:hypothetical protein
VTTMQRRTDVHAPSRLDPADYVWIGSEDAHTGDEYAFEFDWQRFAELTGRPEVAGRDYRDGEDIPWAQVVHASGSTRGCAHCGQTNIRYWGLYLHGPSGEVVAVGSACAGKLSLPSKQAIAQRVEVERRRLDEELSAWRAADERNERAWDELMAQQDAVGGSGAAGGDFVDSLVRYAHKNGRLTDGQRDAVLKGIERREQRAAEQQAKGEAMGDPEPADVPLTSERIQIEGRLAALKVEESGYNEYGVTKMLVIDDRGFRVWGTMPDALTDVLHEQVVREGYSSRDCGIKQALQQGMRSRVQFVAKVERSRKDRTFGFFSRPTKAKVI